MLAILLCISGCAINLLFAIQGHAANIVSLMFCLLCTGFVLGVKYADNY